MTVQRKRLIAEHFKRNGKPKCAMTEQRAKAFVRDNPKDRLHAYKRSFCDHWHVGH